MIWWTGLAPWEFEFPFPGSLVYTFLVAYLNRKFSAGEWERCTGLVFKAHRLVYHSTLGLTVIKKKKQPQVWAE